MIWNNLVHSLNRHLTQYLHIFPFYATITNCTIHWKYALFHPVFFFFLLHFGNTPSLLNKPLKWLLVKTACKGTKTSPRRLNSYFRQISIWLVWNFYSRHWDFNFSFFNFKLHMLSLITFFVNWMVFMKILKFCS